MRYKEAINKLVSILDDSELYEALMTIKKFIERIEPYGIEENEISIFELELSTRSTNVLRRGGINTLEELLNTHIDNLKKFRCMGVKSLKEIKDKVHSMGYILKGEKNEN